MSRAWVSGIVVLAAAVGGIAGAQPAAAALTCDTGVSFTIGTEADLRALASTEACWAVGLTFTQTDNITLTDPWVPIGTMAKPFKGTFDGNGKTISDISITMPSADGSGLFSATDGATITGVHLLNVEITGGAMAYIGGLIGKSVNTVVRNCSASVSITGDNTIGGLIGEADRSHISHCIVAGNVGDAGVRGTRWEAGGIVGYAQRSNIDDVQSSVNVAVSGVSGTSGGGIAGKAVSTNVTNARSTGTVAGLQSIGGLVGYFRVNDSAPASYRIINSTANGGVTADSTDTNAAYAGGVIGTVSVYARAHATLEIRDVQATGRVETNAYAGGLIGMLSLSSDPRFTLSFTLRNTMAMGDVLGSSLIGGSIGGVTGDPREVTVSMAENAALGDVTGSLAVGGFFGDAGSVAIRDSYAAGDVRGTDIVGGFAGESRNGTTITNIFTTGSVSGTGRVGGLVGNVLPVDFTPLATIATYWNPASTGQPSAVSPTSTGALTGASSLTTSQMRASTSFTGWDFDSVWGYECSTSFFPQLRAINSSATALGCPEPDPDPGGTTDSSSSPPPPGPTLLIDEPPSQVSTNQATKNRLPRSQRPGTASATINGEDVPVEMRRAARGAGIRLRAAGIDVALRSTTKSGTRVPLTRKGALVLPRSGRVPMEVTGLISGSTVAQTLFSDPVDLGQRTVNVGGLSSSTATIPTTIPLGQHTLRITGTTGNGQDFVLDVGVIVATPVSALGADPQLKVSGNRSAGRLVVTAHAVQVGCRVHFTLGDSTAIVQASRKGTARTSLVVPRARANNATVTARISGRGCEPNVVTRSIRIAS
jgi:hypothetical protein